MMMMIIIIIIIANCTLFLTRFYHSQCIAIVKSGKQGSSS